MTFADIRQLLRILNGAVDTLETEFAKQSLDFPSLDAPLGASALDAPEERAATSASALEAIDLIVAASAQLTATVRGPFPTLFEVSGQAFLPAVLNFVLAVNGVEILREAAPQGVHARDIAAKANVDDQKISHALRYLATNHIFREVAPDVFANNRISSLMDTGKSVSELQANPQKKYVDTNAVTAFVSLQSHEFIPICAKISDHWTAPDSKFSREPNNTVLNSALGIKGITIFQWLEKPENREIAMRYSVAMSASTFTEPTNGILECFEWESLTAGALVVDVGGGVGNIMMPLYQKYVELKFEIQDRAQAVEHGVKIWSAQFPDALTSGRVVLRSHNFLEIQPAKNAAVFFLRNIAHNWPDAYFIKILRHLRDAAASTTRLVISDRILSYAHPATSSSSEQIAGAAPRNAPQPLLANFGRASITASALDMGVQASMNGLERTFGEFVDVTGKAGWKVERVNRVRGDLCNAFIVCTPA